MYYADVIIFMCQFLVIRWKGVGRSSAEQTLAPNDVTSIPTGNVRALLLVKKKKKLVEEMQRASLRKRV